MAFTLTKFFVGLILFSLIVVSLGTAMIKFGDTYGVETSPSFTKSYDKLTEVSNESLSIGDEVLGPDFGDESNFIIAGKAVLRTIKIAFGAITIPKAIISEAAQSSGFPIPEPFVAALIAITVITVALFGISAFARWQL